MAPAVASVLLPRGGPPPAARGGGAAGRAVRAAGRGLIAVGILVLAFIAYQLWGTGLAEQRSQRALRADFEAQLTSPPTRPLPAQERAPTAPDPAPEPGDAVAQLEIPRLDLDKLVIEGVGVEDLK